jgi:shikimate dehydrogenase
MDLHITKDTRLCVSLAARPGNFGTRFQNHLYRELGLDFVYKAFAITDLRGALAGVRALGIRGCAVSMPFKEACVDLLDDLSPPARRIQSVNTIVNDGGRLTGHNTDHEAVGALLRARQVPVDVDVALRGSGGMARSVAHALRDAGFSRVRVVARDRERGEALARQCGFRWAPDVEGTYPALLVNATPIGMAGDPHADGVPFSEEQVQAALFAFDVVAVPAETPFIRLARAAGKVTLTGAEVIVLQAVEQVVLYTGVRPPEDAVNRAAAFALA